MARRKDLQTPPFLRALFFGNPGSGKTRAVCTAAMDERMGRVLYLNASGNPESVASYPVLPDVVDMEQLKDFNQPYDWLYGGQKENHTFCKQFDLSPPYGTVIVDQLTDVQRMSFSHVLGAGGVGPGDFPRKREWEHYNKVLYQMTNFAKLYYSLADLGIHVIMVCLERVDKDDSTGSVISYRPLMEGQSAQEVPGYALLVVRMAHMSQLDASVRMTLEKDAAFKGATTVGVFGQTGKIMAKNQYGGLPTVMPDPTMTQIMDGIMSGGGHIAT